MADSIRHAGLQCKLLHGHRCGFYGWNRGAFLNSAAPALPAPYWRQRRRGGAGWRGFSSCDLGCLTAAVSIREMARWRPRPPTQERLFLILGFTRDDLVCMFGRRFLLPPCLRGVSFARRSAPSPHPTYVLSRIYSSSDGAETEHPKHYTA